MTKEEEVQLLMSYKINGMTMEKAQALCVGFGLKQLPDFLEDDRETLLMNLLDLGLDIDLCEELIMFVEVHFDELRRL